ncbi:MAG: hypothetical protein ACKOD2_04065 [Ilumatobacteraceae bacterium]
MISAPGATVSAALVVALYVCLIGVWRGRRAARITCVAVLVVVGLVVVSSAWPVVLASWAPRGLALGVIGIAVVALVVALIVDRQPDEPLRGWAPGIAGLVGAYAAVALVTGAAETRIPQFPGPPWTPEFVGDATGGTAFPASAAPAHPGLAPGQFSTIHNDGWMTDAYVGLPVVNPETATVTSFFAGGDCATLAWNAEGNLVAVCVSPTEVRAYVLDPQTLEPLVERHLAPRSVTARVLTDFSGGGYAFVDSDMRLVTPLPDGRLARYDSVTLDQVDEFSVVDRLRPGEQITSALPDAGGLLWFVGQRGTVGLLDPATASASSLVLADPGSGPVDIENSFAVGESGGAYVVTSAELLRLDAAAGEPVVTWRVPYDRGERRKPGQTSRASGTTPSIFRGGDFVAVTDNAEPRMNVFVVDARGAAPRVHCTVPVFADGESATDNSLIAMGDSLVVENNYGYTLLSVAGGRTTTPGLARIDVTDAGCEVAWSSDDVVIPSLVSKGVAADGIVLAYTKRPSILGFDEWWFTAVDAASGEIRWRRLAGVGPLLNNHYAAAYVGPTGNMYVGTVSGVVALVTNAPGQNN